MSRKSAVVICPGRGTYNRTELGYFAKYHAHQNALLDLFDAARNEKNQAAISELDGATSYSSQLLTRGDNASPLIYACAYADFLSIDRDVYDIVAVTGNSMGWYIAQSCANALDASAGFNVVNTMGTLMHESLIGGQTLYPYVDDNWVEIPGKREGLIALTADIPDLHVSIELGGMIVFAGTKEALDNCESRLEKIGDRFPMRLYNHSAFHTRLQDAVAAQGREALALNLFRQPDIPLIDGRGVIWHPGASQTDALYNYTLGHQVVETYNFNAAMKTALREFAPDTIIVLGPGNTLGGAVAQCLIQNNWAGLANKQEFLDLQSSHPILYSMGLEEQRKLIAQ